MSDNVQQIKDRLSIVDVVSQYVKLARAGGSLRARCPFHAEKTPSFHVSPERGTYHCFGCNRGGDIFTFVQEIEGLDFKGALKVLAEKAGVELVYLPAQAGERGGKEQKDERDRLFGLLETATIFYTSRLDDAAKTYLTKRGLKGETMQEFRLGLAGDAWTELSDYLKTKKFSEKEILEAGLAKKNERGTLTDKFRNRIMFPIADSAGRIVGFSGRIFGENASPEAPKYLNSPETPLFHKSRILYGFDKAKQVIRKLNCAVLVEGQVDLLASHQAGWGNTIAVSGTAFTSEHAALIRRMSDNLVIALDADEAGIKAASRAARFALQGGLNVKVVRLPEGLDPADFIQKEGISAWKKTIRDSRDIIFFLLDVLEQHSKGVDGFRRSVEAIVLPFLADVQSPIAREQYVREIAKRLNASEGAIAEALEKLPRAQDAPAREREFSGAKIGVSDLVANDRSTQAFAILLWQESLPKPAIDLKAFRAELEEAIGKNAVESLGKLPPSELERLRFSAERFFGARTSLPRETKTLLRILLKERLSRELAEAGAALKEAEKKGNETETKELITVNKMLTTRIAQLHEKV